MTDKANGQQAPWQYGPISGQIVSAVLARHGFVSTRPGHWQDTGKIDVVVTLATQTRLGAITVSGVVTSLAELPRVAEKGVRQALAHFWADRPDQPILSAMGAFGLHTLDRDQAAAIRDLLEIWHEQWTCEKASPIGAPLVEILPL